MRIHSNHSNNAHTNVWQQEQAFRFGVEKAKEILGDIKVCQLEIAKIAMEVCTKGTGGKTKEGQFTYTKFAEAIEVNRKTLLEWIAVYSYAKDNLPTPPKGRYSPSDYKEARRALTNDRMARRHDLARGNHIAKRIHRTKAKNEKEKQVDYYSHIFLKYASRMRKQLKEQGTKDIPLGIKVELKSVLAEIYQMLEGPQNDR